ncbi:hypothetical protein DUGA6_63230 [Duganella sp. HH105]|nr:hypothetical protein DUGA6_63230 [Duganella sp. HH105]
MIDPSQILQLTCRAPAYQVAGAVQAAAVVIERIGHEALGAQRRTAQVAARQQVPADAQLTGHADRHRMQRFVHHPQQTSCQRRPDRHLLRQRLVSAHVRLAIEDSGRHRRFGRAVGVQQLNVRQARLAPGFQALRRHRLATGVDLAQHAIVTDALLGEVLHQQQPICRRDIDDADFPGDQLRVEGCAVPQGGAAQYHRSAFNQRRKQLFDEAVEIQGGELQHAVRPRQAEEAHRHLRMLDQAAMRDAHAFGASGGTGGVDDVGQVLAVYVHAWIVGRLAVQIERIERQCTQTIGSRQSVLHRSLGQHQGNAAVLRHVGQAVCRILGVQRYVGAAGLQDRQQANNHLERAFDRDAHLGVRPHTQRDQVMRQLVGALIQFGVAHRFVAEQQRRRCRVGVRLLFDQPMDRLSIRVAQCVRAPATQLLALRYAQHFYFIDSQRRPLDQRRHNAIDSSQHVLAHPLHADCFFNLRHEAEALAQIIHRHVHRVVAALLAAQRLHALPRRGGDFLIDVVTIVQQRREQRRAARQAAATLRQRQAGVFVLQQAGQRRVGLAQALQHAAPPQFDADRQRVDEHAQRPFGAFATLHAAEQHGAEHHVVLAGRLGQHQRPRQVEQAGRAQAMTAGLLADTFRQFRRQRQAYLLDVAAVALHVKQTEWRGRLVHVAQHLLEEGFVPGRAHAEARLRHEAAERHRLGQFRRAVLLDQSDFLDDQFQRRMVQHQVMARQLQQPAALLEILERHRPHHRRLAHVDAVMLRIDVGVQALCRSGLHRRQPLDRQFRLALHDLHRLLQALPQHGGAQDVVARDHLVEAGDEAFQQLSAVESQQVRRDIGVALALQHVVEQYPFLQRRQRIDVLDVGRAAWHRRFDAGDLPGIEFDQRQHRRLDGRATGRYQIGRYHHVAAVLLAFNRLCEGRQHRMLEQGPHLHRHAAFAHPFEHAQRHQRMAAQFEERFILGRPHLAALQHLRPSISASACSTSPWGASYSWPPS